MEQEEADHEVGGTRYGEGERTRAWEKGITMWSLEGGGCMVLTSSAPSSEESTAWHVKKLSREIEN